MKAILCRPAFEKVREGETNVHEDMAINEDGQDLV